MVCSCARKEVAGIYEDSGFFSNFKAHVMGYPAPERMGQGIVKGGKLRNAEQVWNI